jgi:hypothetical protein
VSSTDLEMVGVSPAGGKQPPKYIVIPDVSHQ